MFCAPTLNKTSDFAIRSNKSLPNKISIRKMNLAQRAELGTVAEIRWRKEGKKERQTGLGRVWGGGESSFFESLSILGIYASLGTDSEEPREPEIALYWRGTDLHAQTNRLSLPSDMDIWCELICKSLERFITK